jgi:stage V sporulation protein R
MTKSEALEDWQRDVIGIIRQEACYLWPQIRTKVMNEGWATYWHVRLMHELELSDGDFVDFARLNAAVVAPHGMQINPYAMGYRIFEAIFREGGDREIFLSRQVEDDVAFLRNHLTPELVEDLNLFVFGRDQEKIVVKSRDWREVRDGLIRELTHGGVPVVSVDDGDFHHRGELYLVHHHEGVDLDIGYAEKTLGHVFTLWGRPVHLETVRAGRRLVITADGQTITQATV